MYKINTLLKLDRKLYHTQDLAVLWKLSNKNTLYTTIQRYVKRGILISIHKGFYSTVPVDQLDPYLLGISFLHKFSYVSTETVLADRGIIAQTPYTITFVSSVSKKFTVGGRQYLVRQLTARFLLSSVAIETLNGIFIATPERAVADMLYFNPTYHFDNRQLIDWDQVKKLQQEIGYL